MSHTQIQILCSTGAFSRYPDQTGYQAVLKYGPQLEADGFEVMFYPSWYSNIDHITTELRRSGLRFPAMHGEKNIGTALGQTDPAARQHGVELLKENCQLASKLGTTLLVLHLWNWPELDDELDNNLSVLKQCTTIATHYNIELAIETIPGRHFDPLTNVQRALQKDPHARVALDTEFLANYQQLETVFQQSWLWEDSLVHHVHIKDSVGQPFVNGQRRYLQPGEGHVDFVTFFKQLKQKDFRGNLSLEAPAITVDGEIDIAQLNRSLNFMRQYAC